jgi:hypothetical protein
MAWFTRSLRFTILATIVAVALTLGQAVNLPAQESGALRPDSLSNKLPNQWEFSPPSGPTGSDPVNTQGGATRGQDECDVDNLSIAPIPLVPASRMGLTVAEYPTVSWYMPPTSASAVEFVLRDAKDNEIYRAKYALAKSEEGCVLGTSNIMSLTLPAFASLSPLEIGQEYHWELALIYESQERVASDGKIKRVEADPTLELRAQEATPQERVALYADKRLWYETLTTLLELRRETPNDKELEAALDRLFKSADLNLGGMNIISQQAGN